ncbi:hypothetical protein BV25DRAFT_1820841 [Artomyces pyxidatus]|uniref:Uncharacterized protein n=2 Tax=Artomyces pyxidatus TaxID=48021 RepID=A0ACB8TBR8_9AGAM|nr:hypothetical protein BV25DRAFT_1830495 [Artomyces pyxidatus]KAI0065992.1 hypothetical protein BV25DRAFT_1820841 [Artomyces pyxidatus]
MDTMCKPTISSESERHTHELGIPKTVCRPTLARVRNIVRMHETSPARCGSQVRRSSVDVPLAADRSHGRRRQHRFGNNRASVRCCHCLKASS